VTGDGGEDWASRRARRRPPVPAGSRGPDRPRGQGPARPGADGRGPGRGGAARGTATRTGTGRGGKVPGPDAGRGGTGRGGAGRDGAGRDTIGREPAGRRGGSGGAGRKAGSGPAAAGSTGSGSGRGAGGRGGGGASGRAGASGRGGARQRGSAALRAPARAKARLVLLRKNPRHRLNAALVIIGVVLSLFAGRLVQLQGLDWSKYRTLAQEQRTYSIAIPAVRGRITTSDGTVLAMTVQTEQITADPGEISKTGRSQVALKLAGPLAMSPATIFKRLSHPSSPDWVLLKQDVSQAVGSEISDLNQPGVSVTPIYTRSYPNGNLASNLVGFTDFSSPDKLTGEAGLESEFNSLLAGRAGSEEVETGTNGVPIPGTQADVKAPVPARNLRLTIQSSIQYEAEQACRSEVRTSRARNCSVVVMDPRTGAILAMAQYPTFNPGKPITDLAATRNIAVSNVFAPGSTLKPLTVAADLEKGGQTPMSTYTVPDQIDLHGYTFHDAEPHPTARYTIAGILANSLNDGMVQVVQHITPLQQYDYLRAFGLGSGTGLGLPGESTGLLYKPGTSGSAALGGGEPYELSFGQGIGVTAIQMATVYATIANGGVRVQPSIVAGTTSSAGKFTPAPRPSQRRVIEAKTASELMTIMEQVPKVDDEQGEPWGLIAGYPVASKTGTAQVSDNKSGCDLCQYGSSYIGIAPAQDPKLVVAVNVQDPTRQGYYGDEIAGPVFYRVMHFALDNLKIPPTDAKTPYIRLTRP
jgi:cell division protein FtsI (penicillin-binding protein 3)